MTPNEQVREVCAEVMQVYNEALQTYSISIALSGLAYAAASAVHSLEHAVAADDPASVATGVWTNTFHRFLAAVREACVQAQTRGLN